MTKYKWVERKVLNRKQAINAPMPKIPNLYGEHKDSCRCGTCTLVNNKLWKPGTLLLIGRKVYEYAECKRRR